MSERESQRIIALKEAVERCRTSGMSESEIIRLVQAEVSGAAKLRAAIQECLAPDKFMRMSFYEQIVDKKITNEEILAAVQAVRHEKELPA